MLARVAGVYDGDDEMFEGLLTFLNNLPGGSGTVIKPDTVEPKKEYPDYIPPVVSGPKPAVPEHAMTFEEYEAFQHRQMIGAAIGRIVRDTHQHFVAQRIHDELVDEIRGLRNDR